MPRLEVHSPARASRHVELDDGDRSQWTIGRHIDCEVVLEDDRVSRHHARVERRDGKLWLFDCGSRNGTRVNGAMLTGPAQLADGDRIEVCDHHLLFRTRAEIAPGLSQRITLVDGEGLREQVDVELDVSRAAVAARPAPEIALDAVLDLTRSLGRLSQQQLLDRLLEVAFRLLPAATRGVVFVVDGTGADADPVDRLRPVGHRVRSGSAEPGNVRIEISKSVLSQALAERRALLSSHLADDQDLAQSASLMALRVESLACVPILDPADDRPIGVLQLLGMSDAQRFEVGDLELLSALAAAAAVAIQNARMLESYRHEDRLARDLEHARAVQRSFLPRGFPVLDGYRFHAFYEAADSIGGDYYLLEGFGSEEVAVGVGDVSGKGLPAALLMARLSSDVRFSLMQPERAVRSPAVALQQVNTALRGSAPEDRFVSLFLGILNGRDHTVRFANCGHSSALVRRASGAIESHRGQNVGVPLNVLDSVEVADDIFELARGDVVFLYTDGLSELRSPVDAEFGDSGVRAALESAPADGDAVVIGQHVLGCAREFAGGRAPRDDMTFVVFGRTE